MRRDHRDQSSFMESLERRVLLSGTVSGIVDFSIHSEIDDVLIYGPDEGLGSGLAASLIAQAPEADPIHLVLIDSTLEDGSEVDFSPGIQDNTPGGAAGGVSDFFQLSFGTAPNFDIVESFANAAFVPGHWTRQATSPPPVPEPTTLALLALGVGALMRRRKRAA